MDDPLVEKHIDVWMQQSELLWRTVYATPAFAIAIFAGWYVLLKDGQEWLSFAVLAAGFGLMIIQWLIVRRMSQYLNALREKVGDNLSHVQNSTVLVAWVQVELWAGYKLAQSIPMIMASLFLAMLIFAIIK